MIQNKPKLIILMHLCYFIFWAHVSAKPLPPMNAAEIQLALQKLNVVGSALYVAAHPDDENTAVLAYLSKERMLRSAYLSLTRGGGGQNLIGNEKGSELSVLRTQELLAARKIDGAEQFFTRAIDFGYSKTSMETLKKWNKEVILSDLVWIIRKFQPDVIITRFTPDRGGHGHHTSSAILAVEAFSAAGDAAQFPEQLKYVKPWQATRIVWNTWRPQLENRTPDMPSLVASNLGTFNTLLGKSYLEISALSRSMHKSQGFGSSGYRGNYNNYFEHMAGEAAKNDLFDNIDLTWQRIPGAARVATILSRTENEFVPTNPSQIIPQLIEAYRLIQQLEPTPVVQAKLAALREIIRSCAGLWLEAIAKDYAVTAGNTIGLDLMLVNRSPLELNLKQFSITQSKIDTTCHTPLKNNEPYKIKVLLNIPADAKFTHPYWLQKMGDAEYYNVKEQMDIGLPEQPSPLQVNYTLDIQGELITYTVPVYYRWTDRVHGEMYRPLEITPPVTANLSANVFIFPNNQPTEIAVLLKSWANQISGTVRLNLPVGWQTEPREIPLRFAKKYDEASVQFKIKPPQEECADTLGVEIEINKQIYNKSYLQIAHDHIINQTIFPAAAAKIVNFNIQTSGNDIGYIMGSGDEIPLYLEQLGYTVSLLSDNDIENQDLARFDAIIAGTRAYNVRTRLQQQKQILFEYVKNGGTLISLHNTRFGLSADNIGPFPFSISRDRVSVEEAAVKLLAPDHPILNKPNRISHRDFDSWVQERGLYFADEWDTNYVPILSSNDPGEDPKHGGLLYASYGDGHFIYSGYSWFRQLPAGIPGAYRLFVNMISVGNN
jgi:LmbE family N-acetylglucosaminyl deacetylase